MELRHLEVFTVVAREGNVTRASARLDLTPSPVSRTIRELERELGVRLFERRYHELAMTAEAAEILPHALEMLRIARVIQGAAPVPLRAGSSPWGAQRFVRTLVDVAAAEGHELDIDEAMSSELIRGLQFGDLDIALVHLPVDVTGVEYRVLARYRHYLAGYPRADLDPLERGVLVLPSVMNAGTTDRILRQIERAGYTSVEQIDFAELVTAQSRLRRTGELIAVPKAEDTALSNLLDLSALEFTELPDAEEPLSLAVAWRAHDASKRDLVATIVEAIAPAGRPPILL